jgi:hypothetical protein
MIPKKLSQVLKTHSQKWPRSMTSHKGDKVGRGKVRASGV